MKKFLLSTVIGTTLMSTITGGSLALAETKTQSVPVSYVAIPEIATATYMVSIPESLKLTSDKDGVDLKIDLFNKDGGTYIDGAGVDITIASDNGFKLKSNDATLAYSLTYGNAIFNSEKHDAEIHLGKDNTRVVGKAKINATTSITPGSYADTLTYTVKPSGGEI